MSPSSSSINQLQQYEGFALPTYPSSLYFSSNPGISYSVKLFMASSLSLVPKTLSRRASLLNSGLYFQPAFRELCRASSDIFQWGDSFEWGNTKKWLKSIRWVLVAVHWMFQSPYCSWVSSDTGPVKVCGLCSEETPQSIKSCTIFFKVGCEKISYCSATE